MISKILGAVAGAQASEHTSQVGGAGGALLGVAAATVLKRVSLPALVALTAGGYALKKWNDKREAETAKRKSFEQPPKTSTAAA